MAHVRDSDTSLWLHNKLGSSNELWLGGSICSQLNQDVLRNIRECFIELQPQVKLKLLLSFLHIPRRNVDEWKVELEEILEVALVDSDQWVSMLAELLKTYPSCGILNFQIEENASVFTEVVNDLKKPVRKHSDQNLLPLECLYLNRSALTSVVGQLPPTAKHFTLKQKPKSATLRAELLQKSIDAVTNLRKSTAVPSVPIRCRGLIKPVSDAAPLKGIPSRLSVNMCKSRAAPLSRINTPTTKVFSRPASGRKDGGIKLLEIDEQPIGYGRDAKRRKKAAEEAAESRKEKEGSAVPVSQTVTTPDYAVGLLSSPQLPNSNIPAMPANSINYSTAASVAVTVTTAPVNNSPSVTALSSVKPIEEQQQQVLPVADSSDATKFSEQHSTVIHTTTIGTLASLGGASIQVQPQQQHVTLQHPQQQQPQQLPQQQQQQSPHLPANHQVIQQQTLQPPAATVTQPQAQPVLKKLLLTKEQMQEAQEMFNKSNRVTRPEKALILGFIAGSRDNPCPHLGQIVTIMLSENEEKVQQPDGTVQTMIVETHFQMNYSTGEWKRVKKYRRLES